jgi:hypothetical protein
MNRLPILLFTFFCSGCALRSVYVPTNQNVMLFTDKKEMKVIANGGFSTFQLQVGHNPLPHLVTGLSTCFGPGIGIYEGFVGHYDYSENRKWRYELLGGGGYTSNFVRMDKALVPYVKKTNLDFETAAQYYKGYLQPALGYFFKLRMYKLSGSISSSCRVSYLAFDQLIYRKLDGNDPPGYRIDKEYYDKAMFMAEPCFTNKIGRQNLFAVFQAMLIVPYSRQMNIRFTKFSPHVLFSAGVQYNMVFKKSGTSKQ